MFGAHFWPFAFDLFVFGRWVLPFGLRPLVCGLCLLSLGHEPFAFAAWFFASGRCHMRGTVGLAEVLER